MSRRLLVPAFVSVSLAAVGCGGENAAKPANSPGALAPAADANAAIRPPTPQNVPNTSTDTGVSIDDRIRKACGIPDNEAYFAFNSARLQPSDTRVLDKVAVCFTTGPLAGKGMRLVGHADPRGPASYNRELGLTRADSVKRYLGLKGAKSVDSTSRGSDDATGTDETGWARDRRVDVLLSD